MEELADKIYKLVVDAAAEESFRISTIKGAIDAARALCMKALSLEAMHKQERERADMLLVQGMEKESALAVDRARRIHMERCSALVGVAERFRVALNQAQGSLTIDQTTAGTGQAEDDRITVSQVSGRGC